MDEMEFHCAERRFDELNWQAKFRTHDVSNVFVGGQGDLYLMVIVEPRGGVKMRRL
jgi:hypothetical protein